MTSLRSWTSPLARAVADRLDLLSERLEHLGEGLREGVARAVGTTVADAARSAVRALLDSSPGRPTWADDDASTGPWGDPTHDEWGSGGWAGPAGRPDPRVTRRRLVLAAAWQAACGAWRAGRRWPAVLAAGAGLAAGFALAPAGLAAATGAGAAATAAALLATCDVVRRAVDAARRLVAPAF